MEYIQTNAHDDCYQRAPVSLFVGDTGINVNMTVTEPQINSRHSFEKFRTGIVSQ